ncbi:alpha/beta hydrolase [Novipirellula caenicola]|uniref:Cis-3-alkyl-4-alkyloxetan-2-one decarboxylase n=1 Tax=Novipirellula caenicola TaxID=1536901 RepID=A0ABP9VKR2_9BACT
MNWRDYQALQKVTNLGDRFVSYVDEGSGNNTDDDPVILLHGIPVWGYLWHQVLPALATHHRTLIPDLLGFGFSDRRDCFDRSITCQAEMIDQWMEKLGIAQAAFVAHDIGGGVALRLATLFPHRVSRLCVMNTVCYDSWPIELMLQFGHPGAKSLASASKTITSLGVALKSGFATSPNSEVMDGLLAPYHTEVGKLSLIRNAAALNTNQTTEITDRLHRIEVPTLVLWGEDDKFQLAKYGKRLATDIPGAQWEPIANARHFVMLDQPTPVATHLQSFLSATTAAVNSV